MDDQLDLFQNSPKQRKQRKQGSKMDLGHRGKKSSDHQLVGPGVEEHVLADTYDRLIGSESQVIPFPAKKRIGKARRAAEVLLKKKTDKAREAYWRDIVGTMRWQMEKLEISDCVINRELGQFHDLVTAILSNEERGSDSA